MTRTTQKRKPREMERFEGHAAPWMGRAAAAHVAPPPCCGRLLVTLWGKERVPPQGLGDGQTLAGDTGQMRLAAARALPAQGGRRKPPAAGALQGLQGLHSR